MKKIILFVATVVASIGVGATVYAAPNNLNVNTMNVKWSDEFNGTELNKSNWKPQLGDGYAYGGWNLVGWGNQEKENYKEENVSVSNGTMKITAKYEPTTYMGRNYNWTSARIASDGLVNVGLGYVEARIKVPSAPGIWPAFWMLGTNGKNWPENGEIDILEAFNTNNIVQSTIHYPNWQGGDVYNYVQRYLSDKTQWHTYGCYRDGKVIAFYIDRVLIREYSTEDLAAGNKAGKCSVLNDDYYILFNVACGGNLAGGNPPATAGWNATMEVDYVRYYQNKPASQIAKEQEEAAKREAASKAAAAAEAKAKAKPKRAKITSLKNIKKRKISLKIKKISGIKGYQIRYCDNKKFRGYIKKVTSKTKVTLKKLDKRSTYYVKVRAYKVYNKQNIYGAWSKTKHVKIKK